VNATGVMSCAIQMDVGAVATVGAKDVVGAGEIAAVRRLMQSLHHVLIEAVIGVSVAAIISLAQNARHLHNAPNVQHLRRAQNALPRNLQHRARRLHRAMCPTGSPIDN
jgi:hypothetical protein